MGEREHGGGSEIDTTGNRRDMPLARLLPGNTATDNIKETCDLTDLPT